MEALAKKPHSFKEARDGAQAFSDQAATLSPPQLRAMAIERHQTGRLDQAVALYKTYLRIRSGDAPTWSNLGAALRKQGRSELAVGCYRRGLEIKPNDHAPRGNLANALKDLYRLDEAIALHETLVAESPNDVQTRSNFACTIRNAGRFEDALTHLDHAQRLQPDDPRIQWERAQNLLYLGRYREAWPAYEARWRTGDLPPRNFAFPLWQGEDLTGKTLLLHAEQGYGDTILAARYVPLLKERGATVILQCKPELHRLFAKLGADQLLSPDEQPPRCDYHCPMMSLMGRFDTTVDTIPLPATLHIPKEAASKFAHLREQHPNALKIGIVWSGSITFANNANRSVNIDRLIPLAELEGVRLYSLQKGPRARELYDSGADSLIHDMGPNLHDFADTAAAIACMDLIVMTDSSVAHQAASLGKPVINLLERVPYWIYASQDRRTPWYPSMQLLKQNKPGGWDSVFAQVPDLVSTYIHNPQRADSREVVMSNASDSQKRSTQESVGSGEADSRPVKGEKAGVRTLGSMIGEIVWLMSQSPTHKHLSLADLEWALMPPIVLNQYKLFRDGKRPVGAALWAYLSPEAEQRLKVAGRLAPNDWGNNAQFDQSQGLVSTPGGTLWLIELVAPFHNETNRQREQMLTDLMSSAFKGKLFKLMHINPETGRREELSLGQKNS